MPENQSHRYIVSASDAITSGTFLYKFPTSSVTTLVQGKDEREAFAAAREKYPWITCVHSITLADDWEEKKAISAKVLAQIQPMADAQRASYQA